jgi:hypothetical protein
MSEKQTTEDMQPNNELPVGVVFPRHGSWCLDHCRYYAQPLFRFPRARCALSLVPWSAFGSAKTIGWAPTETDEAEEVPFLIDSK